MQQAIAAIKARDMEKGRQLLTQVVKADPRNEAAWLWMTEVVERDVDRIMCLRNALKINPNNDAVKKRLAALEQPSEPPPLSQEEAVPEITPSDSAISVEYSKGVLVVDMEQEQVSLDNEPLKLSPIELELLEVLARHKGQVVPYQQILAEVWGLTGEALTKSHLANIERNIYFLRRRLEEDPQNPSLIQHEEGMGYRLA
ncbi:MAG TPA: winged helix-turn-helix domain-containing protein [Anaerolineae bacterium]